MKKFIFILTLVLFSGCAQWNEFRGKAYDEIGKGILSYCAETSPVARAEFREGVNKAAAPASIDITCPE